MAINYMPGDKLTNPKSGAVYVVRHVEDGTGQRIIYLMAEKSHRRYEKYEREIETWEYTPRAEA